MLRTFPCAEPIGFELAVQGANPAYHSGCEYQRNCQRCIIAFEMRRRGYPVVAMPNPYQMRSGTRGHPNFSGSECFLNVKKEIFLVKDCLEANLIRTLFIQFVNNSPINSRWAISWVHQNQN